MAILGNDSYEWYAYQAKQACVLENARGRTGVLIKGSVLGVRSAKSDRGACRLILKELGAKAIFSLPEAQAKVLLKKCQPLAAAELRPDPRAKKLSARLEHVDAKNFWAVVAALDWPRYCKDARYPEVARTVLLERYSAQQIGRLGKVAGRKRRELQKAVERLEKQARQQLFLGGDDSFYDASAHAVSRGEQAFEDFLREPASFVRKYNRAPVVSENFESCFM